MQKLWAGKAAGKLDQAADDFNSSIAVDSRMFRQDIAGSIAHAGMLAKCGIIPEAEGEGLVNGLSGILCDIENGSLPIDPAAEDIHSFIESALIDRLGDTGKKLHTARSRNDQVATDTRLYLREETEKTVALIKSLIAAIIAQAEENADAVMPGYTHLQRAQPITLGHHLLAYGMMLARDIGRLEDAAGRMNVSPLGACALAGTTYPIDRGMTAAALGFDGFSLNSLDAVADRDFCVELCAALALLMTHLSRFAEELILWTSWEFRFAELSDAYTTGSSIMPQKKNSDMAELIRGKTGRIYGNLMALLTLLKGLPLAYNKDMQEDKEAVFDSFDTANACLSIFAPMLGTMRVNRANMLSAARDGFINATDLADYLTRKGMPFRSAYRLTGMIVSDCIAKGRTLDNLPMEDYKKFSALFESDLYEDIALSTCVEKRTSAGGTGARSIRTQIEYLKQIIA
ncbi:MAG TPA: argininosuccinate lyase [Clostridiales bacterium]|nr:argininosuccinate lyase [Clostridiales bacterium]HBR07345.1 argininosuccinate lyase [Clostridiales bacterium]